MLITLTGENSFALGQELKKLVQDFVAEHTDMGLEHIDGEEASYDRIREAIESLPFLASKKLVVLRAPSANKEFLEKATDLLTDVSDTTDVVVVEPKLDKRTAYYKFLKKKSDFHDFQELDESGLARWLVSAAKDQGGSLSQADARYLIERVGASQQLLASELAKLLNYTPAISRATIDLLTDQTPQGTIFELLDAALSGNTKKALHLYQEQRAMKVDPQQIMAMLAWQLHVLALVKAAGNTDPSVVAKDARLNPFVVRKTQAVARNMTMSHIKHLVHSTLALDIRLKSQAIDADDALQHHILKFAVKK